MKTITKILIALLFIGEAKAWATDCEATNGWRVEINTLVVGKTRVTGNVMVYVSDDENQTVVVFSAESNMFGTEPLPGEQDNYQIETIFQDNIGLTDFTWSKPYGCPRCPPHLDQLSSYITIQSELGSMQLVCKQ